MTIRAIEEHQGIERYLVSRNYDGKDVDRLFHRHESAVSEGSTMNIVCFYCKAPLTEAEAETYLPYDSVYGPCCNYLFEPA